MPDFTATTNRAWPSDTSAEGHYRRCKAWREECEAALALARKDEDEARAAVEREVEHGM